LGRHPGRSLAGTLALVEPHLPHALVGDAARERLRATAGWLPAALSHCLYVECRPTAPGVADLIIDLDVAGREILAGRNPAVALHPALGALPTWVRVASFARAWLDDRNALGSGIADAWLEFDVGTSASDVPEPSVFVDFSEATFHDASTAHRFDVLTAAAESLDRPVAPQTAAALRRCIGALPPHALLLFAGFMLARDTDAVRVCVMGLSRSELASYLRGIDWTGAIARVAGLTELLARDEYGGQTQPAIVHLDVAEAPRASIGMEYPFARQPQLTGTLAERALLEALVSRGLITAPQRDSLRAWLGYDRRTMPHEVWPSLLVRRVNHVKLVLRDDGTEEAKIYLCAEHTPARVAHE
jgi:hypothetical protein